MKNFLRFMLIVILPVIIIAGCSKREGMTVPVTNTPVIAAGTHTVTRTSTVIVNTVTATGTSTISVNTATFTMTSTQVVNTSTFTMTSTATSTATSTETSTTFVTATAIQTVSGGLAQVTPVLGTSARFAVLSYSDLTNIPSSAITGDVGIQPGVRSNITGLLNGDGQVNASYAIYADDDLVPPGTHAMLLQAYNDAGAAYLDAVNALRGTPTSISGNLNGLTLAPGLYESGSTIQISPGGILYLDALGDSNGVFIIRSATSITTESTSQVVLAGNAQAKNVFWVAGSAITLGTNSIMKGTLIASTSISLLNMADLQGRALIQSASAGQISLSQNIIVLP
jgi:hypothetical protein